MNALDDKEILEKQQQAVFELYKKYIDSSLDDDFYLNISTHFVAWTIFEYIFECSNDVKYLNGFDDIDLTKNKNFFKECVNQQVKDLSIKDETIFIEEPISVEEVIAQNEHIEEVINEELIVCSSTIDEITNKLFEGIDSKDYQKVINEYHNRKDCLFNFVIEDNQVLIESYKGSKRETIKIPDYVHGFKESSFPFAEAYDVTHIELGKSLRNLDYMFWGCTLEKIDVSSWDVSNITSMQHTFFDCELKHIDGLASWDVSNVKCMESMFNSCNANYIGDLSNWDVSNVENMDFMFSDCNATFVGDLSSWDVGKVTCFNNMFASSKIKYIGDLSSWNIDKKDQMDNMFKDALFSHEFTSLKDSIVEYTEHLLDGISKSEYQKVIDDYHQKDEHLFEFIIVDDQVLIEKYVGKEREMIKIPDYVSGFEEFGSPFSDEQGLKHIELGKSLTSLAYMFKFCKLETIDLSTLDVSNVTDMSNMFENCFAEHIKGLSSWDVSNVKDMSFMFYESDSKSISDISNWDVSNVEDMSCMFAQCNGEAGIGDLSKWNVMNVKDMSSMFAECEPNYIGDLSAWNVSNVTDMDHMFNESQITNVGDLSKWNVENVKSMRYMFAGCCITTLGDLSSWDVSDVEDMYCMFSESQIANVGDLSKWDVDNVTDFREMFRETKLKTIGDISSWNIDKKDQMDNMFKDALFSHEFTSLKDSIVEYTEHLLDGISKSEYQKAIDDYHQKDEHLFEFIIVDDQVLIEKYVGKERETIKIPDYVSGFKEYGSPFRYERGLKHIELGKSLTSLAYMFYSSELETIDLSTLDVSNVTDMNHMFAHCYAEHIKGLSSWDVSNVRDMSFMFCGSFSESISDISNWDVSNVKYMDHMFNDCNATFVGDLSSWGVSNVSSMISMFAGCGITTLGDLSSWDVSNVTCMSEMFRGCHQLKFLGDLAQWSIYCDSIISVEEMFKGTDKSLDVGNLSHWGEELLANAYGTRYEEDEKTIGGFFKKFIK
ncbi:MAG: BspA family leucine-rich repeat surface protein [Erysipelotrichaceae bacterium]